MDSGTSHYNFGNAILAVSAGLIALKLTMLFTNEDP
jgi:hypothetical protein